MSQLRASSLGTASFGVAVLGCLLGACNAILGIEDAKLDPEFGAGAGGGGEGGRGGDSGGGGSGGADDPCPEYCTTVQERCPTDGEFAVYDSENTCLSLCSFLTPGEPGDTELDTVQCRLSQLEVNEPEVQCPLGGPSGADQCGSTCEVFCRLLGEICPDFFPDDCVTDCVENIPDLGGYDISVTEGNSIQCRFYHVSAAAVAPRTHCEHAAGRLICVD